jgi:hypothetical protein
MDQKGLSKETSPTKRQTFVDPRTKSLDTLAAEGFQIHFISYISEIIWFPCDATDEGRLEGVAPLDNVLDLLLVREITSILEEPKFFRHFTHLGEYPLLEKLLKLWDGLFLKILSPFH